MTIQQRQRSNQSPELKASKLKPQGANKTIGLLCTPAGIETETRGFSQQSSSVVCSKTIKPRGKQNHGFITTWSSGCTHTVCSAVQLTLGANCSRLSGKVGAQISLLHLVCGVIISIASLSGSDFTELRG